MTINWIEVDTGRINADIATLQSNLTETRNHLKTLSERMTQLNSMWSGLASDTMKKRFESDYAQLQILSNAFEQMIKQFEEIRQEYDICENNVRSVVNALKV